MATAAVLPPSDPSFETVERLAQAGLSEEEELEFLKNAINNLGQPGNVEIFKKAMVILGVRAARTDGAFDGIKGTMDMFVQYYGHQFPGILQFQQEWNGYKSEWSSLMTTSQDFASLTGLRYDVYALHLEILSPEIITKEDIDTAVAALKELAKANPVGISTDFQDKFLDLRRREETFPQRFNAYLDRQGVHLEGQAQGLKTQIDIVMTEIAGLDNQIKDATLGLEVASFGGPVGSANAGPALARILALIHANKKKEVDGKRDELKKVEALQPDLDKIRAQFAALAQDFQLLSVNIDLFTRVWNAFHRDASDFAPKFNELENPTTSLPVIYRRNIELVLMVSVPLSQGLKDYASAIHPR